MNLKANSVHIPLKDETVNCIVTSPPYWGLRKYEIPEVIFDGVEGCEHEWGETNLVSKHGSQGDKSTLGGRVPVDGEDRVEVVPQGSFCLHCKAWRGQLGLEPTIDLYLQHIGRVFKELWRVLRNDGTCWLNLGDSYASGKGTCYNPGGGESSLEKKKKEEGRAYPLDRGNKSTLDTMSLKPKDLCLVPFRVALMLQAAGWWVRSDVIWVKPNPMPESVTDRPTRSHEYIFLLTKSGRYFWDQNAVKEPSAWPNGPNSPESISSPYGQGFTRRASWKGSKFEDGKNLVVHPTVGKNRDGDSPVVHGNLPGRDDGGRACNGPGQEYRNIRSVWTIATQPYPDAHYATFPEKLVERCIKAGCPKGGTVLDPFAGSGTVLRVAEKLNRQGIGLDLGYHELQGKRVRNVQKVLFA
jgi:DNA modification methylase